MKRLFTQMLGLMLSLSLSVAAAASNSINSVGVANLEGGALVVKISLRQKLSDLPSSFAINNPARIAFDFRDTANSLDKNTVEIGKGDLRSINIVQAGERTRVVMNLLHPVTYESKIDGNNLLITLRATGAIAGAGTSTNTLFATPEPGDQTHAVRDIDFHRGKNGEARVEVNLSDSNTGIDVSQQGTGIVVQFIKTKLPRNFERRLDVIDFGTPVNTIDTYAQGDNVKMVIEPKGLWEQSAYQTDTKFILEIRPVTVDPNKLVQGTRPGYSGDKLSLDFRNTDVRSLLFAIADFTGLNIVISDTVSGNLTLRLKDVPWDQALDIILEQKGLGMRKVGNVVMIAPKEEIASREKIDLEGKQKISELEETRTESIQLNYQKAIDVQKILGDEKQKILSKRGSVVVDPVTNTLFVQDTPTKLEEIRKFVQQIDTPLRQVMIEARVVQASNEFGRNIGVKLGYTNTLNPAPAGGGGIQSSIGGSTTPGTGGTMTGTANNSNVNIPFTTPNVTGSAGVGALSFLLFNSAATKFLNLEIDALETDGTGKVISSPRVVTANNVEATIESGQDIPYQTTQVSGGTTIPTYAFKKAVLSLKVKPQITPNNSIIMDLTVTQDSPLAAAAAGAPPSISTKKIQTQVLVDNGGTVVVGGIHTQNISNTVNKVPVLGDIPVLGNLFKGSAKLDLKSELLIFVSPKVLQNSLNLR
ncbi:MAG: type IV pilus secretin PilQ [Burkholderiales bacterium]|nr:type IV pilus secretin PilQ [Burkholderiales bacterium]